MVINKILFQTQFKLYLSNILFILLNLFHIILATSTKIELYETDLLLFKISFFSQFYYQALITALILLVLQTSISYIALFRKFKKADLYRITELGINNGNSKDFLKNLRVDPKLIYKWVIDLAEEYKIKSIKRIYLTDTSIPNAMTIDLIPLPLCRVTWIVLDVNVIEILDEREIKAVITHELGHVKHIDGLINIIRYGINYYVFIAYSLKLLEMIYLIIIADPPIAVQILLRIGYFLVVLLILYVLTIINHLLMNFSRRQAELMADFYASKKITRNNTINALILLGQRLDVVTVFGTEFKWLGKRENKNDVTREFLQGIKDLPPEELSKEISKQKALYIYVSQRLQNLVKDLYVPLTPEQIDDYSKNACEKLLELRKEQLEKGLLTEHKLRTELNKLTIDWLSVDSDKDHYLVDEEIEKLIEILKKNSNKELFENDAYQRRVFFGRDHPTMKNRILFLYYAMPSEKTI